MLSLTIACSGHLYKQKTIPRIFLHALISLAQQNASSGILAGEISATSFPCFTIPNYQQFVRLSALFCPFHFVSAPLMARPQKVPERFWILCASLSKYCQEACYVFKYPSFKFLGAKDVPGCYKIQKVKNSLADFRMQIP